MTAITAPAKVFAGRWRIVEMDTRCRRYLDLVEEAHMTFRGTAGGTIAFGTLEGSLDVIYLMRERLARAVFSWEGQDGADDVRGSGWATLGADGRLVGHFHVEDGKVSAFACERG